MSGKADFVRNNPALTASSALAAVALALGGVQRHRSATCNPSQASARNQRSLRSSGARSGALSGPFARGSKPTWVSAWREGIGAPC